MIVVGVASLVGCQTNANSDGALHGRILLWHSWNEADTVVLEQLLQEFAEIHPNVTIITAAIPADELRTRYEATAPQGLGPNLLIGNADWIPDLAAQSLIASFSEQDVSVFNFLSSTIRTVQNESGGEIYGLPLSVSMDTLYYNTAQVGRPARTLAELWLEAENGRIVAIPATFERAYWGIYAFGNGLFDNDGHFTIEESGFEGWLATLKEVQEIPNVVLSRDSMALQQLFASGRAAYYVGRPEELMALQEALGEFSVGVAALPAGDAGSSRTLLTVEALLLNSTSSDQQTAIAVEVAKFLTNQEQSTQLMRRAGRVPANGRVEINQQIYPDMLGFKLQALTAVNLPPDAPRKPIFDLGNLAYANVLSGLLTPFEAVCDFGRGLIEVAPGLNVTLPVECPMPVEDS
jgi:ABC-type glycerol-3-phosphate transport system substrate-binding protein